MKKVYNYGDPDCQYNNSEFKINFGSEPANLEVLADDPLTRNVALNVIKLIIDYDHRKIDIWFNSDTVQYGLHDSVTEQDVLNAIKQLESSKPRTMVFIEYSGTGNCLNFEVFRCNIPDPKSWKFTYKVVNRGTYHEVPSYNPCWITGLL